MYEKVSFLLLICCLVIVHSRRVDRNSDAHGCSLIIKSCQTNCEEERNHYVRWIVNIINRTVECSLLNSPSALPNGVSESTHVIFSVPCCPENSSASASTISKSASSKPIPLPAGNQGPDEMKIDTLIILGVGTLISILLICVFLFGGLMIYHKRKRQTTVDIVKEKVETKLPPIRTKRYENNEIIEMAAAAKANNCPILNGECQKQTISVQTSPNKNSETMGTSFVTSTEEKEKVTLEDPNDYSIAELEYSNQTPLKNRHSSLHSIFSLSNDNLSSDFMKLEIADDFGIHGSFVLPNSNVYEEESAYVPYPGFRTSDVSTTSDLHSTSNVQVLSVKTKPVDTEDPYVLAPPLKSNRSQQKAEKQDPYQKLVPNGCCSYNDNSDDYNMLSHKTGVISHDAKVLLALNNNLKATDSESKCEDVSLSNVGSNYTSEVAGFKW